MKNEKPSFTHIYYMCSIVFHFNQVMPNFTLEEIRECMNHT